MACYNTDAFVVVGRASLPVGREREFLAIEIRPIFEAVHEHQLRYRKAAVREGEREWLNTANEHLCKPRYYFSLGRFNLMWFCLLDDLDLAVRSYRPFDPRPDHFNMRPDSETFAHQVTVCPIPRFRPQKECLDSFTCLKPWLDAPLLDGKVLPLAGMCQLKLNDMAAASSGTTFLRSLVRVLHSLGNRDLETGELLPRTGPRLKAFVLESYAWNELVLLLWSTSFERIARAVDEISSLTVGRVICFLESEPTGVDPQDIKDNQALARVLRKRVREDVMMLGASAIEFRDRDGDVTRPSQEDMLQRHVLINTVTSVGPRADLDTKAVLDEISDDDRLVWNTRWFVESGHQHQVRRILQEQDPTGGTAKVLGKGDILCPITAQGSSRELVRRIYDEREGLAGMFGVNADHSTIALPDAVLDYTRPRIEDHYSVFRPALMIPQHRIDELHRVLVRTRFCKVASMRLLNMVSVYNDGVSDNVMFSSFSELHPFVLWVLRQVEMYLSRRLEANELHLITDATHYWVDEFEQAFRNRYRSSHRLGDISEVNLDFRGGVQQLVAALHAAANATGSVLGIPPSLVWIGGRAGASSSAYCASVHVSPAHAFHPEHFATILGHELGHAWMWTPRHDEDLEQGQRRLTDPRSRRELFAEILSQVERATTSRVQSKLEGHDQLLEEIACDLVGYCFSFASRAELFSWWNLHHFQQTVMIRGSRDDSPEIDTMLRFLFRVLSVLSLSRVEISSLSGRFEEWLRGIGGGGWGSETVQGLIQTAGRLRDALLFSKAGSLLRELQDAVVSQYDGVLQRAHPSGQEAWARQCQAAKRKIAEGEVLEFNPPAGCEGPEPAFAFSHAVMVAYLELIAEKDEWRAASLRRGQDGKPATSTLRDAPPFLFDPRGGTFVADPRARREYTMWRTTLVMSLWDMSMKEKAAYWLELADRYYTGTVEESNGPKARPPPS